MLALNKGNKPWQLLEATRGKKSAGVHSGHLELQEATPESTMNWRSSHSHSLSLDLCPYKTIIKALFERKCSRVP